VVYITTPATPSCFLAFFSNPYFLFKILSFIILVVSFRYPSDFVLVIVLAIRVTLFYGTTQLQGNICTCLEHASCTHSGHVLHRVWQLIKSCCSLIARFLLASRPHSGCISCAFWMHLLHILDASCTHSKYVQSLPWT